jgi:hypothetical protein
LHRSAVALQNDCAGEVNQLAQTLEQKHALGCFACGADRVGYHSQQTAYIADEDIDSVHITILIHSKMRIILYQKDGRVAKICDSVCNCLKRPGKSEMGDTVAVLLSDYI